MDFLIRKAAAEDYEGLCAVITATGRLALALFVALPALTGNAEAQEGKETGAMVRFSERLIMGGFGYAYGLAVADLDKDGDLDVTAADADGRCLYWFENDGRGNFTRHVIQEKHPQPRLERHAIGDVNRDGHPDVVIVENFHGDLLWFENSGRPSEGRLWKEHVITLGGLPSAYDVALADLDGDGDLDVAASSWKGNAVAWFENAGAPGQGPWVKHLIDENLPESRTIRVADFNRDGRLDLLATGAAAKLVVWYEHPGDPRTQPWKRHIIDNTSARPLHGQPVDMDGDGDLDVVMAVGMGGDSQVGAVVWYENNGRPEAGPWRKHVIAELLPQAFEAFAADLDGDGQMEVVVTAWGQPGGVFLFKHEGEPRGRWRQQVLKSPWVRANQVVVADLDGDGRPDIIAQAERGTNELRWWRNEGRPR
ncbi:MAG: VCBS repeat-containing protein [Planctomycetes bacterium]|nr:VCBS repeat-containing protein [Planctomycetota bacterium]